MSDELKTLHSLEEPAGPVDDQQDLYLRLSAGPEADRSRRSRDNEPLVDCWKPVGWVVAEAVSEAARLFDDERGTWGPLDRTEDHD